MGECRDRAELPAPSCLGMATPVQRGTHTHPREVKPTPEVTSQKSSLLTQVWLQQLEGMAAACSLGGTFQNVPHHRQPITPREGDPRMHSHLQGSQHLLRQLLSPVPLSPARQATPLGALPRVEQLGGLVREGEQQPAPHGASLPSQPGSCGPAPPSLTTQAQKLSHRVAKQLSARDPLAQALLLHSILPLSKEFIS